MQMMGYGGRQDRRVRAQHRVQEMWLCIVLMEHQRCIYAYVSRCDSVYVRVSNCVSLWVGADLVMRGLFWGLHVRFSVLWLCVCLTGSAAAWA
jgi:hypothetical protein